MRQRRILTKITCFFHIFVPLRTFNNLRNQNNIAYVSSVFIKGHMQEIGLLGLSVKVLKKKKLFNAIFCMYCLKKEALIQTF